MDLDTKNKWRLRFKIYSIGLVTIVLIAGIALALVDKVAAFGAVAMAIITFATGVFGVDYWTKPSDDKE